MRRLVFALLASFVASIAPANGGDGWAPSETLRVGSPAAANYTFTVEARAGDPTTTRMRFSAPDGQTGGRQYEGDPSWVQIAGLRDGRVDAGDPLRLNLVDVAWTTNGATLIGLRAWRQSAAPCRVTYDPYAVFDAAVNGSSPRVRYSEAKSRAYNLAHYVWAGPDARADITVDTCGPRPRLVRQPAP